MKLLKKTLLLSVGVLVCACVEKAGVPDAEYDAADAKLYAAEAVALEPAVAKPVPEIARGALPELHAGSRATVHYINATLVTDDPAEAMSHAETLLLELGGEIQHSSASGTNANMSGFVPPESRAKFRKAILDLGKVSNESSSSSDITHEVRRLRRRTALLQDADRQVAQTFGTNPDADSAEALALLRELTQREQQSVRTQLENYERQLRFAQVNISFSKHDPNAPR